MVLARVEERPLHFKNNKRQFDMFMEREGSRHLPQSICTLKINYNDQCLSYVVILIS